MAPSTPGSRNLPKGWLRRVPQNRCRDSRAPAEKSRPPRDLPGHPRESRQASACLAADEFFSARISNPHTRTAYAHQVSRFLTWCENEGLELHQVTPGLAGRFLDELPGGAPTQNQALAGLRHFFDTLVARHAAVLNPFQSVRGVRHPFGEGRTPEVTVDQARQLLASIKTATCTGFGTGRSSGRSSTPAPGSGPSAGSGCRT